MDDKPKWIMDDYTSIGQRLREIEYEKRQAMKKKSPVEVELVVTKAEAKPRQCLVCCGRGKVYACDGSGAIVVCDRCAGKGYLYS